MTLATYITFVHAKNLGFGKHTVALGEPKLHAIRNVRPTFNKIIPNSMMLTSSQNNPNSDTHSLCRPSLRSVGLQFDGQKNCSKSKVHQSNRRLLGWYCRLGIGEYHCHQCQHCKRRIPSCESSDNAYIKRRLKL